MGNKLYVSNLIGHIYLVTIKEKIDWNLCAYFPILLFIQNEEVALPIACFQDPKKDKLESND